MFLLNCTTGSPAGEPAPAKLFQKEPWNDPHFFPLAVWLQSPANAQKYKQAGINTYVGLWRGPTEAQLSQLQDAGMRVVCAQNAFARGHLDHPSILAWMHNDEPDNAQPLKDGKGYGPPVPPKEIQNDYQRMRSVDPTRPILLNLGQGVAWDGWYGRGVRTRHPEDYPEYIQGCDIASFDIYPAVHDHPEVAGNLWYVAHGVERLLKWSGSEQVVWNCLECTRIGNVERKPTPHEVRCEAWMSLIHGSQGLIYFVHQFKPVFREAALLDDPEMLSAITALNRQITELAPVLKSPAEIKVKVQTSNPAVPVAVMGKKYGASLYVFAVAMRAGTTQATFTFEENVAGSVEVLGEERSLKANVRSFSDSFGPWDVHLYRFDAAP